MIEDEAKKKWCPFARVSLTRDNNECYQIGNRAVVEGDVTNQSPIGLCIGSKCMAWQETQSGKSMAGDQLLKPEGYCGLAGKP